LAAISWRCFCKVAQRCAWLCGIRPVFKVAAEPAKAPEIVRADVLDDTSVASAITGADAVVNLVGILTETPTQTYRAVHVEAARRIALAAQRHGVMRVIHL